MILAVVAGIIAITTGLALFAQSREPEEWHWSDWSGVLSNVLLGFLFLVLALLVQDRESRMGTAMANLELWESIGTISSESVRSFGSATDRALSIPAQALAGMQLFAFAGMPEKLVFTGTVSSAYSNIALHVFVRSRTLPIVARRRLLNDSQTLIQELGRMASVEPALAVREELHALAKHVDFTLRLESWWAHESNPDTAAAYKNAIGTVAVSDIERLFSEELQVLHDWRAVPDQNFTVRVDAYNDPAALSGFHAPWYVGKVGDGSYREYNFAAKVENHTAIQVSTGLTAAGGRQDNGIFGPLRHSEVKLTNLRIRGRRRMQGLVESELGARFAILVCELDNGNALIIDGNHRLAACLLSRDENPEQWFGSDPLITVFTIRACSGQSSMLTFDASRRDPPVEGWSSGFTPDLPRLASASEPT